MISIKRFIEQRRQNPEPGKDIAVPNTESDRVAALTRMVLLLFDGIATNVVRGSDTDCQALRQTFRGLGNKMREPQSAIGLLGISSDAVEALETYCQRTTDYLQERNEERQAVVTMLTATVAELSGQTDASVARVHALEKRIEGASELDDIQLLRASLGDILRGLRE
jgi:hypothetical protein